MREALDDSFFENNRAIGEVKSKMNDELHQLK